MIKSMPRKSFVFFIILIFIILPFSFSRPNVPLVYAQLNQSNDIQVQLDVAGCNNNGICEPPDETALSCPVDCAVVIPPPPPSGGGSSGSRPITPIPENIYIYNLSIQPSFTSAVIYWNSSVSAQSTIKWGETTEVKEGALRAVVFARNHKAELINLKPGTMYFFTIESEDVNGKTNLNPPIYFFTKFFKDTTFPLNPRNVRASADIPGITIFWQNPPDPNFSYVRIMRHEDRFRGDPFSGKLIYEGKEEKFLDTDVTAGQKYFYTLFARDTKGNFSSGVGASAIAYSPKEIPTPIPIQENPPEVFISETFFAHQYNQLVEPLTSFQTITINNNEGTVVDIDSKTLPDDWLEIKNRRGEIVGQYLFSFNSDSGRYQSVIAPLEKTGTYDVKIYRYRNDIPTLISEGLLNVKENTISKIPESSFGIYADYYIYIIILLFVLLLPLFFSRRRRKTQQK